MKNLLLASMLLFNYSIHQASQENISENTQIFLHFCSPNNCISNHKSPYGKKKCLLECAAVYKQQSENTNDPTLKKNLQSKSGVYIDISNGQSSRIIINKNYNLITNPQERSFLKSHDCNTKK